ncbi:MAG: helix-turn-helix domain-containing protein [Pseudomonadota bacterium]
MKASRPDQEASPDWAGADTGGALGRGLRVLVALNDLRTASVAGLVAETGLAKPTVIRLLKTLVSEGFAAQDAATLTYGVTHRVAALSRALSERDPSEEALQGVLDTLADALKWPTEFLVPEGDSMVIRMSNRERAAIKLALFERRRFPMAESAAGEAFLAADLTGYTLLGYPSLAPNLRVASVAVPGGVGALSLVHFDDVVSIETLETALLPSLRAAAREIATLYGRD